jgi:hypothetical protein
MKNVVNVNEPYFDVSFITAKDGLKSFRQNVLSIDIRNSVSEMINQWQVVLVPRDNIKSFDTLYELVEPMSYCEIKIRNRLSEPRIVMRGFVSNVAKEFDIYSGGPQRRLVISGENYGKVIRMAYIHYAYGLDPLTTVGAAGTRAPLFFGYGVDIVTGLNSRPSNVMRQIFNNLIKPNFNNIQSYLVDRTKVTDQITSENADFVGVRQTPGDIAASKIGGFVLDIDDDGVDGIRQSELNLGYIDPAAGAQEQSVLEFMQNYIGLPWNELYTDDAPNATYLVFRPKPWRDRNGDFVGDTYFGGDSRANIPQDRQDEAKPKIVEADEIIGYRLNRSDEDVYNYFFTDVINSSWGKNFESVVRSLPDNENPHYTAGVLNFTDQQGRQAQKTSDKLDFSRIELFGFRKARIATRFLSVPIGAHEGTIDDVINQSRILNDILFDALEQNSQLETGTINIQGREDVRAGMYIKMKADRGDTDYSLYYVVAVQHTLVAFQNYVTILTVSRGEGHLNYVNNNKENII